jgi:putative transposase
MNRKPYSSDMTDAQWKELAYLVSPDTARNPSTCADIREVINGILYALESGCPWDMLPNDLPPGDIVRWYLQEWTRDGTWEQIHNVLSPKVRH